MLYIKNDYYIYFTILLDMIYQHLSSHTKKEKQNYEFISSPSLLTN